MLINKKDNKKRGPCKGPSFFGILPLGTTEVMPCDGHPWPSHFKVYRKSDPLKEKKRTGKVFQEEKNSIQSRKTKIYQ